MPSSVPLIFPTRDSVQYWDGPEATWSQLYDIYWPQSLNLNPKVFIGIPELIPGPMKGSILNDADFP